MDYIYHLLVLVGIYGILALSLNLVVGHAGILSVAHAAFYGIGAYATAILTTRAQAGFLSSMVLGVLVAGLLAMTIGLVLTKLSGDYLALASFGFNVIVFGIFLNWDGLTRGPLGIPGIPRPAILGLAFSSNLHFLALTFLVTALVYLIIQYLTKVHFGRVLKAIREDKVAAKACGYDADRYQVVVFALGGALAAMAGSLYAAYITYVDPSTFSVMESILILTMIIVGGLANAKGSLLGVFLLILLPESLRFLGLPGTIAAQTQQMIFGLVLILVILYRPRGLLGEFRL